MKPFVRSSLSVLSIVLVLVSVVLVRASRTENLSVAALRQNASSTEVCSGNLETPLAPATQNDVRESCRALAALLASRASRFARFKGEESKDKVLGGWEGTLTPPGFATSDCSLLVDVDGDPFYTCEAEFGGDKQTAAKMYSVLSAAADAALPAGWQHWFQKTESDEEHVYRAGPDHSSCYIELDLDNGRQLQIDLRQPDPGDLWAVRLHAYSKARNW